MAYIDLAILAIYYLLSSIIGVVLCIITWISYVSVYLMYRYIRVKLTDYHQPDGRKVIMVTGASSGAGLALARHFYRKGFTVIATYRTTTQPGLKDLKEMSDENSASDISKVKPHMFLIHMDVRSKDSIKKASEEVDDILDTYNLEYYCLINNAGVSPDGPLEWTSRDSLYQVLETNVVGLIMVTREFVKKIVENKGRIINVSSGLHMIPFRSWPGYTCTKSAVTRFSESLDVSLRRYGAACCCAMPGVCLSATNLVYLKAKNREKSKSELTNEELKLYSSSIDNYSNVIFNLVKKVLEQSGRDPEEVSKQHGITIPSSVLKNLKVIEKQTTDEEVNTRFIDRITRYIAGGTQAEISKDFIRTYDYAVLSKNPYTHVYPGSPTYANFFGPMTNFAPPEIFRYIGLLVFENMIR